MKGKSYIYLDYAATTPTDTRVLEAMQPFFTRNFGNPASIHHFGRESRHAIDTARQQIANLIHARPGEIYFTAGGTESNNILIQGIARANRQRGNHLITTAIEHPSVLNTFRLLEKEGFRVTYLRPDSGGRILPEQLKAAITADTVFVSIMFVNNEIGTIQPIAELAKTAHSAQAFFHTDAVQAFGKLPIDVSELEVDALSFSGHKIYGPKGIGGFYLRKGTPIQPLLGGGGQENGLRPGTLNVPGIVGLSIAAKLFEEKRETIYQQLHQLSNDFIRSLREQIPQIQINGNREFCSPYIVNISFPGCDNQALQMFLDMEGIAVSTGSACHSGTIEPSHVLQAMGFPESRIQSALRFSFGPNTTREELTRVVEVLRNAIQQLQ